MVVLEEHLHFRCSPKPVFVMKETKREKQNTNLEH